MPYLIARLASFCSSNLGMNQPGLKGITILVVEDEHVFRTTTALFLTERGVNVLEGSDGRTGLNVFLQNQNRIDIVLTDIKMPKMNGFELFRNIQAVKPGCKMIFASGFEVPAHERNIVPDKIFLAKPFRGQQLIWKIWDVLRSDFSGLLKQELPDYDYGFLKPTTEEAKTRKPKSFLKSCKLPRAFRLESRAW
jgi:DNA-binding response OmpR family regulator